MAGRLNRILRRCMRPALGALVIFAIAPAVQAQWLPPLGAAPPGEIAQRLRAQGFVLAGPLYRRSSVYVVDVSAGPEGRERLIVDAWSGEVLQRFVARRGRWRPEFGGEFGESPSVFGPPPASEFYAAGSGGPPEEPARAKLKPRAAETGRQPVRVAPAASAQPENVQNGGSHTAPATTTSTPAPPLSSPSSQPAETANPPTSAPNASATAPAVDSARPADSSPAEASSSAPPAPSSEFKQEAPRGAVVVRTDADRSTSSALKVETQSAGAASGAPPAEKQAAPQPGPAPQAKVETEKSEKASSSAPAQSASAAASPGAPKPLSPAPVVKSGRKSRVNDIPVMPLE